MCSYDFINLKSAANSVFCCLNFFLVYELFVIRSCTSLACFFILCLKNINQCPSFLSDGYAQ